MDKYSTIGDNNLDGKHNNAFVCCYMPGSFLVLAKHLLQSHPFLASSNGPPPEIVKICAEKFHKACHHLGSYSSRRAQRKIHVTCYVADFKICIKTHKKTMR